MTPAASLSVGVPETNTFRRMAPGSQGALGLVSFAHLRDPASVWNHKTGFEHPYSTITCCSCRNAWLFTRNKLDPPHGNWPGLPRRLPCLPARLRPLLLLLASSLPWHTLSSTPVYIPFSRNEYALSQSITKASSDSIVFHWENYEHNLKSECLHWENQIKASQKGIP